MVTYDQAKQTDSAADEADERLREACEACTACPWCGMQAAQHPNEDCGLIAAEAMIAVDIALEESPCDHC